MDEEEDEFVMRKKGSGGMTKKLEIMETTMSALERKIHQQDSTIAVLIGEIKILKSEISSWEVVPN